MLRPGSVPYRAGIADYFAMPMEDRSFFGSPRPARGARVVFEPDKLLAAREQSGRRAWPVSDEDGLVVDEDVRGVLLWPASLWRVEDLERPVRLAPATRWVRVLAFTVVEQVPTWRVAGRHGYAVAWVIDLARALTAEQVEALAALPEEQEEQEEPLRAALWQRWRQARRSGSPLGCGLTVLHTAVHDAARDVSASLFSPVREDGRGTLTDPAWQSAGRAAEAAALGLGAPELLPAGQAAALARRWTSVFGTPTPPYLGSA